MDTAQTIERPSRAGGVCNDNYEAVVTTCVEFHWQIQQTDCDGGHAPEYTHPTLASTSASSIPTPSCHNMSEHPSGTTERARLNAKLQLQALRTATDLGCTSSPADDDDTGAVSGLSKYIARGLAYTVGSALGYIPPPSADTCLQAFLVPNNAGLTAGARAWSKHAHRSGNSHSESVSSDEIASMKWWGTPSGPVASINARAVELFWKIWRGATWRNLHWLPHQMLVYEVRVPEGYGMRWAQDWKEQEAGSVEAQADGSSSSPKSAPETKRALPAIMWIFRGFVEPMMENGHEVGWRH